MHFFSPIRPLLKGWLLSLIGWGLVAFVIAAYFVSRGDTWSAHIQPGLTNWLPWAFFTPLLFRLVSRFPIDRQSWKLSSVVHLACCAVVLAISFGWKSWMEQNRPFGVAGGPPRFGEPRSEFRHGMTDDPGLPPNRRGPGGPREWNGNFDGPRGPGPFRRPNRPGTPPDFPDMGGPPPHGHFQGMPPGPPQHHGPFSFDLFRILSFDLPIYLMIVSGAHAALFFRREQERAASLARARLDALRMQLQPHFLFNTLNTIAGLVHEEPDKADAMLTALSDLLRLSLETSNALELPLSREIEFVERYLHIMHARFEERLQFEIDATPDTHAALVPPLLLQPLVENAVEHGLQPKPEGGLVKIRAWRDNDTLHLSVTDNGIGMREETPPREGIGLGNTRARLRELYGNTAQLSMRSENGVTVAIALPFRTNANLRS